MVGELAEGPDSTDLRRVDMVPAVKTFGVRLKLQAPASGGNELGASITHTAAPSPLILDTMPGWTSGAPRDSLCLE